MTGPLPLAVETADNNALRPTAEHAAQRELAALAAADDPSLRPAGWALSPQATACFVLGGAAGDTPIAPKYIGPRRLVETAIATLATDQALLLVGPPGVAKSRLSEHLAAAISHDSSLVVQGAAGLEEHHLRYGWNYAELLARGPSHRALAPTPLMRAMAGGKIVRLEELTRIAPEVQDALIAPLSEKRLAIPELSDTLVAKPGFNLIATANLDDRGVHAMSAALRRRFNTVALPAPATLEDEVAIITARLDDCAPGQPSDPSTLALAARRAAQILRELRAGQAETPSAGKIAFAPAMTGCSTADAIAAVSTARAATAFFAPGADALLHRLAAPIAAAVVARAEDRDLLSHYVDQVLAARAMDTDWSVLYHGFQDWLAATA